MGRDKKAGSGEYLEQKNYKDREKETKMDKKAFLKSKYNRIKEMVPPETKIQIKKLLGKEVNEAVLIRGGAWVAAGAKKLEPEVIRKTGKKITGNIETEHQLPMVSRSRDVFIENQLQKGKYTWDRMLIIQNPYGLVPLSALALFTTKEACQVRFTVSGKLPKDDVTGTVHKWTKEHRLPILGLYPGRASSVTIDLLDKAEQVIDSKSFKLVCPKLHKNMRDMVKIEKFSGASAFNLTFVYGGDTCYPYAFDSAGDIRYFVERTPKAYGLHPLSRGRFLFADKNVLMPTFSNPHATQALDMDLLGRVHNIYNVEKGLHHDANEMTPGGNLIAAASSLIKYNEDAILEIDRETGKVVKELPLDTLFDDTYKDSIDWAHINTVSYDAKNHTVIACLRNLHSVIQIDWETNELMWILCNPKFWEGTAMEDKVLKPADDSDAWFYQAHAAYLLPEDLDGNPDTKHLIIYDNHWHKRRSVSFFDKDPLSYVRIYTINEKEGTVSLLRNFESIKSKIRSNGIYVEDRDRLFVMSGYLEPSQDGYDGMIYEYQYSTGELLNHYATVNSFYRAYEFWADYDEMAEPLETKSDYMRGMLTQPRPLSENVNFADAEPMPSHKTRKRQKTDERKWARKELKTKIWKEEMKKSGGNVIDYEEELTHIFMNRREDFLYINGIDHLVNKIYFVGNTHTYVQDYSWTKQTLPALFAKMVYYVAIPLQGLPKDRYNIYLQCHDKLLKTKKYIKVD